VDSYHQTFWSTTPLTNIRISFAPSHPPNAVHALAFVTGSQNAMTMTTIPPINARATIFITHPTYGLTLICPRYLCSHIPETYLPTPLLDLFVFVPLALATGLETPVD